MAQNHQIKMSLMFDADTSKAKSSLKDLQTSLNGLTASIEQGEFPMTNKIQEAYIAAEKLKKALNASVNMQTGKFDIAKFNVQLKQSGLSAQELGKKFVGAGTAGAQAFSQLATTIANAEIPTRRVSTLVDNLAKSLKQTAQWQISSSIIHGFTGALSQAYGYAKDLNQSLNDIRIVTGENLEFMERYAAQANKAARALSSTTNEYAKASLIFYQQGLDESEVAKRTEATIKMANVTGEAAQDISSYMTAIWNNFDNGTKSLEYYADAITALGAATASSTEEIAGGMQQFASVAETVGLSYEYAASALATVVSATRQSEETVGTSFKTIFARLSSLQLGETLEDGTTLTKYSAALAKVGVDIQDGNGQLKTMDQILDELGAKWNTISREQQNALAYTVAGTRQYNNFISLLDNYEDFKINVDLAIDSEGTLDAQQQIYAESWEAAAKRAKAAAESIYEKLLDDDFFIGMLKGLEKLLVHVDKFIDAIGGLPGVLSLISTLMLRIFNTQATEAVRNMTYGLKTFLGIAAAEAGKTKQEFMNETRKVITRTRADVSNNPAANAELEALEKKIELEQTYISVQNSLSEKQRSEYQMEMQVLDVLRNQVKEKQKQAELAKQKLFDSSIDLFEGYSPVSEDNYTARVKKVEEQARAAQTSQEAEESLADIDTQISLKQAQLDRARKMAQDEARFYVNNVAKNHSGAGVSQVDGEFQYHAKAKIKGSNRTTTEQMQTWHSEVLGPAFAAVEAIEEELSQLEAKGEELLQISLAAEAETEKIAQEITDIKPKSVEKVKRALDTYSMYSSGESELRKQDLDSLLAEGASLDVNSTDYEKQLAKFKEKLQQFAREYELELGEETNAVIQELLTEVEKGKAERKLDFASTQSKLNSAHEADTDKYGFYDRRDQEGKLVATSGQQIRNALQTEMGAQFTDQAWMKYEAALKNQTNSVREAQAATKSYGEQVDQTAEGLKKKAEKDLPDAAQSFTNLTMGITSVTTALSSMKGVFDIWSNTDMTFSEKLLTTFTSMGMAIGSVISAVSALQKVSLSSIATTAKETLTTWLNTLAQKANAEARDEVENEALEQADSIDKVNKEKQEELATDTAKATLDKATGSKSGGAGDGIDDAIGDMASEAVSDKATDAISDAAGEVVEDAAGEVVEEVGEKVVKEVGEEVAEEAAEKVGEQVVKKGGKKVAEKGGSALSKAFAKALPKLGSIAGGVALITAGIAVLAGAIALTVKGYNAAETAAKNAAKSAEHFAEIATQAQQDYNNTVNTIASYQDALKGMEDLTKGTAKWDAALLETNKHAFDLINQFDELAGKYHFEDGKVVFDEGALEEAEKLQMAKAQKAQATSYAASITAKKAQGEADIVKLARQMESDEDAKMKWANLGAAAGTGLASGALIGAGIGTIAGSAAYGVGALPGWALGAIIGGGAGALTGVTAGGIAMLADNISSENEENVMRELVDLYGKNASAFDSDTEFKKILEQTSIDLEDDALIDSLMRNREELAKNVAALYANEEAIKAQTQAMIDAENQDNEDYMKSEYKDYLAIFGQQDVDKEGDGTKRAQVEDDVKKLWKGRNKKEDGFWDTYLNEMYGDEADSYRIKNAAGGNVTLQRKNEDGVWETVGEKNSLNEKVAESNLIEKRLAVLDEDEIEDYEEKAAKIETSLSNAGIREDRIRNIGLAYANGKAIDLSAFTGAQLNNIDYTQIADRALREAMQTAAANAEESWQKILDGYSNHVQEELIKFDESITEHGYDVTREQMDLYAEALSDFTQTAGNDAATIFNENLTAVLEANSDKAADIIALVTGIDWSNPATGLSQFSQGMYALGIHVDTLGWTIDGIGTTLGELELNNGLITDIEYVVELFKSLDKLSGQLTLGSLFDYYDYQDLVTSGVVSPEDFIETLTGEYRLINPNVHLNDNNLDFYKAVADAAGREKASVADDADKDFRNRLKASLGSNEYDTGTLLSTLQNMSDEEYQSYIKNAKASNMPVSRTEAIAQAESILLARDQLSTFSGKTSYSKERQAWIDYAEANADRIARNFAANTNLAKNYNLDADDINGDSLEVYGNEYYGGGEGRDKWNAWYDLKELSGGLSAALRDGDYSQLSKYEQEYVSEERFNQLLSTYNDRLNTGYAQSIYDKYQEAKDSTQTYEKLQTEARDSTALQKLYNEFATIASDPQDYEGAVSLDDRVQEFNKIIGSAETIDELEALRNNPIFDTLFKNSTVQDTYKKMMSSLKSLNRDEINLLDKTEDEARARERINDTLSETKDLYNKIASVDLLDNLAQQRTETLQLLGADTRLLAQARSQQKTDIHSLKQITDKLGVQVKTDKEGHILNYEQIRTAAIGTYDQKAVEDLIGKLQSGEEAIDTFEDNIAESEAFLDDYWNSIAQGISSYISGINSSISESTKSLNYYKNVIGLLGEDVLGITSEMLESLRAANQQAANANLSAAKSQYELIKEAREQAQAELALASDEDYSTLLKQVENLEQQEAQALNAMNESFVAALQQASQNFAEEIQQIGQNFEKAMTGTYGSYEEMQRIMQQQSTISDQYLSDYKRLYEVTKLSRELEKSIDTTNSIQGKQELNEIQQKLLAMQSEGAEVSAHDLEVAQKQYELTLAKIALEESQNAKNQVRLQKMANGSWGYVYTQDSEQMAQAQQNYEDKAYALRESNQHYLETLSSQIISTQAELQNELDKIAAMENLSVEQRQEKMRQTIAFYDERMQYLAGEYDKTIAYDQDILNSAQTFSDTLLGMLYPDMSSATSIYDQFHELMGDEGTGVIGEAYTAIEKYAAGVENVFSITDSNIGNFADNMVATLSTVTEAMEDSIAVMQQVVIAQAQSWNTNRVFGTDRNNNTITRGMAYSQLKNWYSMYNPKQEGESAADYEARIIQGLYNLTDDELITLWNSAVGLTQMDGTGYDYIDRFATGGYTGEWGPEGRLAVVDQKELILNAQDTQNLLQTMQVMDQMLRNIELQAAAAAFDHALSATLPKSGNGDTLQQEVTIHAEFPNATNHSEIEQAFDTLINRASQFANRNR